MVPVQGLQTPLQRKPEKNEAQAASPYQCNEPEVDSNGRSNVRLAEKANRGKLCAPTFSPPLKPCPRARQRPPQCSWLQLTHWLLITADPLHNCESCKMNYLWISVSNTSTCLALSFLNLLKEESSYLVFTTEILFFSVWGIVHSNRYYW